MESEHAFGSGDLTPELVRNAQFDEVDGRIDAAQVRTFLDRIASSIDVFLSGDAQVALRREFARNAEIAQQVLDAGQAASEQLRRQAAEEARAVLQEVEQAAAAIRAEATAEAAGIRANVEELRGRMVQDLRDLYDRIGASLYRFEREEAQPEAVAAAPASPPVEYANMYGSPVDVRADEPAPSEQLAPAWTQLPEQAYTAPADPSDPFAVVEDEPLAPGEPLIDMRDLQDDAAVTAESDGASASWLEGPVLEPIEDEPDASGGSWLDDPVEKSADDRRAEALLAGTAGMEDEPLAAPTPGPLDPAGGASPDALAVRQLILDSLAAGQPRETIEAYLRDQMGFVEPGALVDAALITPE